MFNQPNKKRVNCFVAAAIVLTLGGGGNLSSLCKDYEKHH
jgi:hypothetical protein